MTTENTKTAPAETPLEGSPEDWIRELREAGWTSKGMTIWISPGGIMFRGPALALQKKRKHPELAFPPTAREEQSDMVAIGSVRRSLFTSYDSDWNGWVRDTTASLEVEGGMVSVSAMREKVLRVAQNLMLANRTMRDFSDAGWRCFGCDFYTTDLKEAAAHFGDRDDAEEFKPLCKWWRMMSDDERIGTLQDTIQQLNDALFAKSPAPPEAPEGQPKWRCEFCGKVQNTRQYERAYARIGQGEIRPGPMLRGEPLCKWWRMMSEG